MAAVDLAEVAKERKIKYFLSTFSAGCAPSLFRRRLLERCSARALALPGSPRGST